MNTPGKDRFEGTASEYSTAAINAFDLAALEEMDPALADGFKVAYDREVPLELRYNIMNSLDLNFLKDCKMLLLINKTLELLKTLEPESCFKENQINPML